MASVKENTTIKQYQDFVEEVYGLPNDRSFSLWDMVTNVERFTMRGLKGIRKGDKEKIKINLLIALSWFTSTMNRLHIDLDEEIWQRFPYLCSYCGFCPCCCQEKTIEKRQEVSSENIDKRPKTLPEFQQMFEEIYPPASRTLEHAGVHLAEELGEFSEAIMVFRGERKDEDFKRVEVESADLFSCFMGVLSSAGINAAKELSIIFSENCHVCKQAPCVCSFNSITRFQS